MTLKIPALRIFGKIFEEKVDGKLTRTVRLDQILPSRDAALPADSDRLWLRFGFVFRGTEKPMLPSFVIDDRGNENHRLRLMEWVYEKGDLYPRGEIFGYEVKGAGNWVETQIFVREIELQLRYFTWVVDDLKAPPAGLTVHRFGLADPTAEKAERIARPEDWLLPLKRSQATCWRLPVDFK